MLQDLGLLVLRVPVGLMMFFGHGIGKVQKLLAGNVEFADPLGLGPGPSLALAALAECLGSLMVTAGIKARWAAIPVAFTMLVAGFLFHADDPWKRKEMAMLYAAAFLAIALAGPGRYSVDGMMSGRKGR